MGERARRVWHSLSQAVHHHAYELQPSPAEVRHLVGQVRDLAAQAASSTASKLIEPNGLIGKAKLDEAAGSGPVQRW
ncbi:MAG: hypothetical protein WBR28_28380 [Mycobacterium sp.]